MITISAQITLKRLLVLPTFSLARLAKYVSPQLLQKKQEEKLSGTTKTKVFGTDPTVINVRINVVSRLISIVSSRWATTDTQCPSIRSTCLFLAALLPERSNTQTR
jgi:hypothetical protein